MNEFSDHVLYQSAMRRFYLFQFFALSDSHKRIAITMLRKIGLRDIFNKWFVGGILNLIGLSSVVRRFRRS